MNTLNTTDNTSSDQDQENLEDTQLPEVSDQEPVIDDADESEVVVTIGSEPSSETEEEQKPNNNWVKELRKQHRESQRKLRELEAKLQDKAEPKEVKLSTKPKLEDFDYDADHFEQALDKWYDQKREYDQHIAAQKTADEEYKNAWQSRLNTYSKHRDELRVRDFDDAEDNVQQTLSQTQQAIIVQGAENSALLVYALGKNPKKAAELASITDPVKFAFAVAKIEKDLKTTQRKQIPPPEKTVSGSARLSSTADATLERLRVEAEKTGNYTKVIAYKRQSRNN